MLRRQGAFPALVGPPLLVGLFLSPFGHAESDESLFGIPLETVIQSELLGASRSGSPPGLKFANAQIGDAAAAAAQWDAADHWYHARPRQLPKVLRGADAALQVAVTKDEQLFWLQLRASVSDCSNTSRWLRDALSRKYSGSEWKPGPESESQVLQTDSLSIALSCDPELTLEYLFPALREVAYEQQFDEERIFLRTKEERHRAYVTRLRRQYEARTWLRGSRTRIESYLGVQTMHGNPELANRPADESASYEPTLAGAPFPRTASHEITVDPEGQLIRLSSESRDPERTLETQLLADLNAVFGEPYRRAPGTQRFRIGYQWLVLRHREQVTSLVYLNQRLQDQQKERAKRAEEARFEADTRGL